jgi:pentatricopeptide repeat protein
MYVLGAVLGVAGLQTVAALAFPRGLSTRSSTAAALTPGAHAAPQHFTLVCSASATPQRSSVDRGAIEQQKQLCRDISSMKFGRWRQVMPRLQQGRDAGVPCNPHIVSAAIVVLGKARQFNDVLRVWQMMQHDGVKPNVPVYCALIDACGKSGHADKALKFLQQMQADGLIPDERCYNSAVDAQAQRGMVDEALKVLVQMKTAGLMPNVFSYSGVIKACSRSGQYERAIAVLKHMKSVGLAPNENLLQLYHQCMQ